MKFERYRKARCNAVSPMFKMLVLSLFLLSLLPASLSHASEMASPIHSTMRLGIIPYLSPRNLIKTYQPLKEYLEVSLGRPVEIYTSSSFSQFQAESCMDKFDVVITAAHFARMLENECRYTPLLQFATKGKSLIVTSKARPVTTVSALKQRTIAVPDKLSLASIVALSYLNKQGLNVQSDVKLMVVPSFVSAILAVQNGEAAAAITAAAVLEKMPPELQNSVTQLTDAGTFANLVILSAQGTDKQEISTLRKFMLRTSSNPALFRKLLEPIGLGNLAAASDSEMKKIDAYLPVTREMLENQF